MGIKKDRILWEHSLCWIVTHARRNHKYFSSLFWQDITISLAMFHYLCSRPIIGNSTISFKHERDGNPAVNVKKILQSCVTGKQWCARPLKSVTNTTITNPHDESTTYNQKCALLSNKKLHGQTLLKKKIILNKIMTQLREEYYLTLILIDFPDQSWHFAIYECKSRSQIQI